MEIRVMSQEAGALRVVVADDDAGMRCYYERTLNILGHQVVSSAQNGHDLVNCVHELAPDLIITDIDMPGMNGLEALENIDEDTACIIVSALDEPEGLRERHEAHLVSYLVKPVRRSDLAAAIAKAMTSISDDNPHYDC